MPAAVPVSLAKLAAGAERYYLATVAAGVEDHRPPGLEPDGVWLGSGAAGMHLDGAVSAAGLEAILRGAHPATGERLNPAQRRVRVAGFDLVFAAPKSVSVLFGIADALEAATVRDAHEAAVADALGYLERRAVSARRRVGTTRSSVPTRGVIAAGFLHRTSRSADPHLHTHVLVANLVEGEDGRWSALDARGLYAHRLTAGYLYQARLRHELRLRTGVCFGPVGKGVANLAGIEGDVVAHFSQRRTQVEDQLAAWGSNGGRAAQMAALVTRPAKDTSRSVDDLRREWRARAARLGLSPDRVRSVLGAAPRSRSAPAGAAGTPAPVTVPPPSAPVGAPGAPARQAGPDPIDTAAVVAALVEQGRGFGRRDLLRALAQGFAMGADVATIERLSDQVVESAGLVDVSARAERWRRRDGGSLMTGVVEGRWTTIEHLRTEAFLVREAVERLAPAGPTAAPALALEATLARRPELSESQRVAVRSLVCGGRGLDVVWAEPGPSGTDVVEAARQAWQQAGYQVVGVAQSAGGSAALEAATGIEVLSPASTGLSGSRGRRSAQPGPGPRDARPTVVVVSGAQAWEVSALSELLRSYEGAKIVLLADRGRDGPASAVLAELGHRVSAVEARRLPDPVAERGPAPVRVAPDPVHAVVVGLSAPALRRALVDDWWEATQRGKATVMVGQGRAEVEALSYEARSRLRGTGQLGEVVVPGRVELAVGDSVLLRWDHARYGLEQGRPATVVGLADGPSGQDRSGQDRSGQDRSGQDRSGQDRTGQDRPGTPRSGPARSGTARTGPGPALLLEAGDARQAAVPVAALRRGQLVHAYAVTAADLGGVAGAHALVLGGRGVLDDSPARQPGAERSDGAGRSGNERTVVHYVLGPEVLNHRILRSQAHDPLGRRDPLLQLAPGRAEGEEPTRTLGDLGEEVDRLRAELIGGLPPDPAPGRRLLEEERAALALGLANARALAPALVGRWEVAAAGVVDRQRELDSAGARREAWVEGHRAELVRYASLLEAAGQRQAVLGRVAEVALPGHVTQLLGSLPVEPTGRALWREAAGAVEGFRERWGVADRHRALGHEHPLEPRRSMERAEVERTLDTVQRRLGLTRQREQRLDRGIERDPERDLRRDMARSLGF